MKKYVIKQGECISSVGYLHGFFPETLWDHPENIRLKEERKNPNTLMPGDAIFIPDKAAKRESCETGKEHTFRLLGVPAKLRLRFLRNGEARTRVPYRLTIDKLIFDGFTNSNGEIEHSVMPDAITGTLVLGEGEHQETYTLLLRELDPADSVSGAQGRLLNLGYYAGAVDGVMNPQTGAALTRFQRERNLPATGQVDTATAAALVAAHGS